MKRLFFLGSMILLFLPSCLSPSKDSESVSSASAEYKKEVASGGIPDTLIKKITQIEFPFHVDIENKNESLEINLDDAQKYFGTIYSEELEMPNQLIWGVGRFSISEEMQGLIIRSLQLPVGSGEHNNFMLYVLDAKGKILDKSSIAHDYGWDGGFDTQNCVINKEKEISFTFRKGVDGYGLDSEIKGRGTYAINETSGEITRQSIEVESYTNKIDTEEQAFDAKNITNNGVPDIIRKDLSGRFEHGLTWKDRMGENYLIFTTRSSSSKEKESEDDMDYEMYGYHYVFDGKAKYPKRLWKTTDFIRNCSFDSMLDLKKDLVEVRDFNGNDIAETLYTYTIGCVSDVSPYDVKLILHEGKEKLAVRGKTRFTFDGTFLEGAEYSIDTSKFSNIPKQFIWQSEERFRRNSIIHF